MKPLKNIISEEQLEELATRSNFRAGKQIVKDGDVSILETKTFSVVAEVKYGDGQKRTVKLESTPKGFKWKCTCSNRKDLFCKHAAAVGLSVIE